MIGADGEEIVDLDSWLAHAPPEKGLDQWRDGYSAKEQAKAWLRPGSPAVPRELGDALSKLDLGEADGLIARPEHVTELDRYGRGRQHDLLVDARCEGVSRFIVGVEAKACESFDGVVAGRAGAVPPSKKRARCNLLARALFGRPVIDEASGEILAPDLAAHGYQLWTAAVGTLVEAQRAGAGDAVLIIHQFIPRDRGAGVTRDTRDWAGALSANAKQFENFLSALGDPPVTSQETEVVAAGTRLHVLKVESELD